MHSFLVDHQALALTQIAPRPPVSLPRVLFPISPFVEPVPKPTIRVLDAFTFRGSLLGAAGLARDPIRLALPRVQTFLVSTAPRRHVKALAPVYQFPFAISLSARFSSSLSATSRFSFPFSSRSLDELKWCRAANPTHLFWPCPAVFVRFRRLHPTSHRAALPRGAFTVPSCALRCPPCGTTVAARPLTIAHEGA